MDKYDLKCKFCDKSLNCVYCPMEQTLEDGWTDEELEEIDREINEALIRKELDMTNEEKIINIGVNLACYYEDWETQAIELIRRFRDELNELLEEK